MRIVDNLIQGLLLIFLTKILGQAADDNTYSQYLTSRGIDNFCPYFQNRGPSKQEDLKNCTWYKENSCCLNSELQMAFSTLNAIPGASKKCVSYLNYLYCYICAPDQNTFFQQSRVVVCEEFCNRIYYYCKDAMLKGMKIQDMYMNGKEFCEGRRFKTTKQSDGGCFYFDPNSMITNDKSPLKVTHIGSLLFSGLLIQIITIFSIE